MPADNVKFNWGEESSTNKKTAFNWGEEKVAVKAKPPINVPTKYSWADTSDKKVKLADSSNYSISHTTTADSSTDSEIDTFLKKPIIQKLQKEFGNPKVSGQKASFTDKAFFNPLTNTMSLNLDALKRKYQNDGVINTPEAKKLLEAKLTESYIAELSHARQIKQYGTKKFIGKYLTSDMPNLIMQKITGNDKYDPYKMPGTLEHEAHSKIEPELKKEVFFDKVLTEVTKRQEQRAEKRLAPISKKVMVLPPDVFETRKEKLKDPSWKENKKNYFVYSKQTSTLFLFDHKHNLIDKTIAGRGKDKGDAYNDVDLERGINGTIKTTPAGAYSINRVFAKEQPDNNKTYGTDIWHFGNEKSKSAAIHGIFKPEYKKRMQILNDPKIKAKCFSWGCINAKDDFMLRNEDKVTVGDSVFVTKEPKRASKK